MTFDHWFPRHPTSRVAITYVQRWSTGPALVQENVTGTARLENRRNFAKHEGILWIRGHHDEDSAEGQALLAAYALYRSVAA